MKINGKTLIMVAILIASFLLGYVLGCSRTPKEIITPSTPVEIIRDSIIRDTLYKENEVIKWKIKDVNEQYDKEVSIIKSNTDSANLIYFSDYIGQYSNQQGTTKGN